MVFIVFGALMSFLVYSSIKTNFDLVTKEYYKDELAYQSVIEAKSNSMNLKSSIALKVDKDSIKLDLPSEMTGKLIHGSLWLYCPSNAKNDKKFVISSAEKTAFAFPLEGTNAANYIAKVQWQADGISYNNEQQVRIP